MPRGEFSIDVRASFSQLRADLERATNVIAQWGAQLDQQLAGKVTTGFKTIENASKKATDSMSSGAKKSEENLGRIERKMQDLSKRIRETDSVWERLALQMQRDVINLSNIFVRRLTFSVVTAIERGIINSFRKIIDLISKAIQVGSEFEAAMIKTAAVASGGVIGLTKNFDILSGSARNLATTTIFTATEIAKSMFELVSVGLSVTETQQAIASATQFAAATQAELGQATNLVTLVMKAFRLEGNALAGVADVLVTAINTTALTVDRLVNAMKFAAPAAGAFNQNIDDTVAVVAAFVNVTKAGGLSGRAFRFMLQALADPSEKAKSKLAELNIELQEIDPRFVRVSDILRRFAVSTFDAADSVAIFGRRAGPVVASFMESFRLNLAAGVDLFKDFSKNVVENTGIAADQARVFQTSISDQFKILLSNVTEIGIRLFFRVREALQKILDFTNTILREFIIRFDLVEAAVTRVTTALILLSTTLTTRLTVAALGALAPLKALQGAIRNLALAFTFFNKTAGFGVVSSLGKASKASAGVFFNFTRLGKLVKGAGVLAVFLTLIETISRIVEVLGGWSEVSQKLAREFPQLSRAIDLVGRAISNLLPDIDTIAKAFLGLLSLIVKGSIVLSEFQRESAGVLGRAIFGDTMDQNIEDLKKFGEELDTLRENYDDLRDAVERETEAERTLAEQQASMRELLSQQITGTDSFNNSVDALNLAFIRLKGQGFEAEEAVLILRSTIIRLLSVAEQYPERFPIPEVLQNLSDILDGLTPRVTEARNALEELSLVTPEQLIQGLNDINTVIDEQGRKFIPQLIEKYKKFRDQANELELNQGEVSEALDRTKNSFIEQGVTLRQLGEDFEITVDSIEVDSLRLINVLDIDIFKTFQEEAAEALGFLTASQVDDAIGEFITNILFMKSRLDDLGIEGFQATAQQVFDFVNSIKASADQMQEQELFKKLIPVLSDDLNLEGVENLDQLMAKLEEFLGVNEDTASRSQTAFETFYQEISKGFGRAIGEMIFSASSFGDFVEDLFKGLVRKLITDVFAGLFAFLSEQLFGTEQELEGFAGNTKDALNKAFGPDGDGTKILVGFASFVTGIFAGMSGNAVVQIGSIVSSFIAGFAAGGPVLGAISVGLSLLGNLFGSMANRARESVKDITASIVGGFEVSDALADKIKDKIQEVGTATKATLLLLDEVIKEMDLTVGFAFSQAVEAARDLVNAIATGSVDAAEGIATLGRVIEELASNIDSMADFNQTTGLFGLLFFQVEEGLISATDAGKILEASFESLVRASDQFGLAGGEALRKIIDGAKEAGIEVEAIKDFLIDIANAIASNLEPVIGGAFAKFERLTGKIGDFQDKIQSASERIIELREEIVRLNREGGNADEIQKLKEEITELEEQIFRWTERLVKLDGKLKLNKSGMDNFTFTVEALALEMQDLMSSGIPLTQVLEIFGGRLEEVALIAKNLGLELPPVVQQFLDLMETLKDFPRIQRLLEALGGMTSTLQDFVSKGLKPSIEMFEAFEDQVKRTFRQILNNTGDSEAALEAIRPQLLLLAQLAALWGFELDKVTRNLLEMAGIDLEGLTEDTVSLKDIGVEMEEGFKKVSGALVGGPGTGTSRPQSVVGKLEKLIRVIENHLIPALGGVGSVGEDSAAKVAGGMEDIDNKARGATRSVRRLNRNLGRLGNHDTGGAFQPIPRVPSFDIGGVVPGPGASMLAEVHRGEIIGSNMQIVSSLMEALSKLGLDRSSMDFSNVKLSPSFNIRIGNREIEDFVADEVRDQSINGRVLFETDSVGRLT